MVGLKIILRWGKLGTVGSHLPKARLMLAFSIPIPSHTDLSASFVTYVPSREAEACQPSLLPAESEDPGSFPLTGSWGAMGRFSASLGASDPSAMWLQENRGEETCFWEQTTHLCAAYSKLEAKQPPPTFCVFPFELLLWAYPSEGNYPTTLK